MKIPPREMIDAVGGGDFFDVGKVIFDVLTKQGSLEKYHDVLDIGCGCGRVSTQLTDYLDPTSKYHGVDVVKPMVDWCRENITSEYPNFKFHHAELTNTYYSEGGVDASTYRFPFKDRSFDYVFLTSVFTHLKPADAKNYLNEIKRMLRPGGKMFATFFLINERYQQARTKDKALVTFDFGQHPYWFNDPNRPEMIAAYDEKYILDAIVAAGFTVKTISYGGWVSGGGWIFQDTIVARAG